jgi:hypothetical protein
VSEQLPPEGLEALADELRRLAPRDQGLDRDATLFRAGRASASRGWLWPIATAVSSLIAVVLGTALYLQPPPQTVTEHAPVEPAAVSPDYGLADLPSTEDLSRHRRVRDHLLSRGLDGLPIPPAPPPPPRSSDLLNGDLMP